MNPLFCLILGLVLTTACTVPKYTLQQKSADTAILFKQTDSIIIQSNSLFLTQEFSKLPVATVDNAASTHLLYIPNKQLSFTPSENVLSLLQKTTNYDYFVVTNLHKTKDEIEAPINILKTTKDKRSQANVTLRIYNINTGNLTVEQSCIGQDFKAKGTRTGTISKTSNKLSTKCIEKITTSFIKKSNDIHHSKSK